MEVISCNKVVKQFHNFTALDQVSLSVKKGSILGLLGPNGAGKTTLIRIINNITMPDSGEVLFEGEPLVKEKLANIGYLPEERGLYKKMKVGEQSLYLAQLKGVPLSVAKKRLKEWFEKFELELWWDKKVEQLSKGMAQKVQFITTVLHNPSLLILDEPFTGFDPVNVQLIRDEILKMRDSGHSIILSTHNMASVEELCDHIVLLDRAKVIEEGKLEEIRRSHGKSEFEFYYRGAQEYNLSQLSTSVLSQRQEAIEGGYRAVVELHSGTSHSELLQRAASKLEIISFREIIPKMEDIFIKLISKPKNDAKE
ncbi:MAG: ATP-binding cassette domain-containing protein [Bacteroidales bacterium]